MADFSKFKVGNTSYNVKDANAGRSLSVNGNQLQLKNAGGTAISTVTLPGGGGKAVIAEVTAQTTPNLWQTNEPLTVSRYVDGEYNSLNVSDIAGLLEKGAVAYIAFDNVLINVTDVKFGIGGFTLSATSTVGDYNRVYGNPAISGNPTDTFNINIAYDGYSDTAVGNYSSGGGVASYTWFNQQVSVPLLNVGQVLDIAQDIGDLSFDANAMFTVLDGGGFVSITLGGEIATCVYVDEVFGGRKTAYFYFAEGRRVNGNPQDDKWVTINDLGELCRTQ